MSERYGEVILLALMDLGCEKCEKQIDGLTNVHDLFKRNGHRTSIVILVGPNEAADKIVEWRRRLPPGLEMVQEDPRFNVRDILGGKNQDFFIFDKCGRESFHIPYPQSFLYYHYTISALHNTLQNWCGECPRGERLERVRYRPVASTQSVHLIDASGSVKAVLRPADENAENSLEIEYRPVSTNPFRTPPEPTEIPFTTPIHVSTNGRLTSQITDSQETGHRTENRRDNEYQTDRGTSEQTDRQTDWRPNQAHTTDDRTSQRQTSDIRPGERGRRIGPRRRIRCRKGPRGERCRRIKYGRRGYRTTAPPETTTGTASWMTPYPNVNTRTTTVNGFYETTTFDSDYEAQYYKINFGATADGEEGDEDSTEATFENRPSGGGIYNRGRNKPGQGTNRHWRPGGSDATSSQGQSGHPRKPSSSGSNEEWENTDKVESKPDGGTEFETDIGGDKSSKNLADGNGNRDRDGRNEKTSTSILPRVPYDINESGYLYPKRINGVDCSIFTDEYCFDLQYKSRKVHHCCYKGVYLTKSCVPGACSNDSFSLCCFQRFQQARYRCCHEDRVNCDTPVAFSQCVYELFVEAAGYDEDWDAGTHGAATQNDIASKKGGKMNEDDLGSGKREKKGGKSGEFGACCPRHVAALHWNVESRAVDYAVPNMKLIYGDTELVGRLRDQSEVKLKLSKIDALQYSCPYAERYPTCDIYPYVPFGRRRS